MNPNKMVNLTDHSLECRRAYLAFSAVKVMLEKAQRECPCCQAKRKP